MKKKLLLILLILPLVGFSQTKNVTSPNDVVELIKKHVTCNWSKNTVDTYKAGNPNLQLTGIVTCMFADMNVLRTAVKNKCNLIITHEPIFYSHLDETTSLADDQVFKEKLKFIKDNNLVIFRFHDHIHQTEPDGIYKGMINELDLKEYAVDGSQTSFLIPETTVSDFSKEIKTLFNLESVRVIGNPEMNFTKLTFLAGAPGGKSHINQLSKPETEVLIAGEAPEWETYMYANDAVQQGKKKAVIFVGHIKSEEAGMKYCAEWLETFINGIPIIFVENQPNFKVF